MDSRKKQQRTKENYRQIYGWNIYVEESHRIAIDSYSLWCNRGKPRHGPQADAMRKSRSQFNYALWFCKEIKQMIESNRIAQKSLAKNTMNFGMN